ncbi:MAG: hypothetical protein HQ564_02800 [Candidatus Saganbacteria bacterium]|nr:hypothetical protein [Candidatus Saganbacteria bacterium]
MKKEKIEFCIPKLIKLSSHAGYGAACGPGTGAADNCANGTSNSSTSCIVGNVVSGSQAGVTCDGGGTAEDTICKGGTTGYDTCITGDSATGVY